MTEPASQDQAAATSTPDGGGPVRLGERTSGGSPAANQSKTEPYPPSSGHAAPAGSSGAAPGGEAPTGVPQEQLGVGAADPQAPSHPGVAARPFTDVASGAGPVSTGQAQRATGSQGVPEEPIETDRAASGTAMTTPAPTFSDAPGDAKTVPVVSHESLEGSSETAPTVQGARTPVE